MLSHTIDIGTEGRLEIRDYTNLTSKYVELWIQQLGPFPIFLPGIPWWDVVDGVQSPVGSYALQRNTIKQRVSRVYVPANAISFTWHLENTGTSEMDGPVDFTVTLQSGLTQAKAYLKVDTEWKRAIPWVKENGVWKVAVPQGMLNTEWKAAI